jgi:hypothetical protein
VPTRSPPQLSSSAPSRLLLRMKDAIAGEERERRIHDENKPREKRKTKKVKDSKDAAEVEVVAAVFAVAAWWLCPWAAQRVPPNCAASPWVLCTYTRGLDQPLRYLIQAEIAAFRRCDKSLISVSAGRGPALAIRRVQVSFFSYGVV